MFDIEKSLEQQILSFNRSRPVVIFTESVDIRVLEAVSYLCRYIKPVLLESEERIRSLYENEAAAIDRSRVEFTISESRFINIASEHGILDEFCHFYRGQLESEGSRKTTEEIRSAVSDPCLFGILCVKFGYADMVVGGITHEPITFFRPMLKYLKKRKVQCETGIFVLSDEHSEKVFPKNIIVFGDVGVNATMDEETLANLAVDICTITRNIIPEDVLSNINGAIVSYSNHGSDEGPSPVLVNKASSLVPGLLEEYILKDQRYKTINIEGEVKVNVALSERSAMYYSKPGEKDWQGGTNVIICPNLDMGNMLYHLYATRFPDAKKFTIISGIGFSAVDLAKDCSADDIRLAIKATMLNLLQKEDWKKTPQDNFFPMYRILSINPGSTSTKVSLYEGEYQILSEELQHKPEELKEFENEPVTSQFEYRRTMVVNFLTENGYSVKDLDAVSARGGLLKPIPHGTYAVNDLMLQHLKAGISGEHASNLGGIIAESLTNGSNVPAFITDPVVVDEADDRVKITGIKSIKREIISHALNQIASARRYAYENETFYENINVIVCHMGGGISIGAHHRGRYVDVNNALNGEGPFSPQRSGTIPAGALIDLCFSGRLSEKEIRFLNVGGGGFYDLLGTTDLREIIEQAKTDAFAETVIEALIYQTAKAICSLLPAFNGEAVEQVILTGGMVRSDFLVSEIEGIINQLNCGVTVYPGENEMDALAAGAVRVLQGKEQIKQYSSELFSK